MHNYMMMIGGESVPGSDTFEVLNPSTGKLAGLAPVCSRGQLDMAMECAGKAFKEWRLDERVRREALGKAAAAVAAAAPELARILTMEQGKPLGTDAPGDANFEVMGCVGWLAYYANLERNPEIVRDDELAYSEVVRRPLGVVAAITPWNYPLLLAVWKVAPALLAGNTVVLKPSPYTPLSSLLLGQVLQEVLPPGVLNVVTGPDELGGWMTGHPVPRKVTFTGSVATGRMVNMAAASDMKRVTLELGGNDAAIVLDDVDPSAVAEKLFWGAFTNNGQVCCAIKRLYVSEGLYGKVVEAIAEQARLVQVGDGFDADTQLGPINNATQFNRVSDLVADAVRSGARVVSGGRPIQGPGHFFEPTILADVTDGTRIVDEEQFGPVLPIVSYRDLDDAVERANASHFGLGGSVWSSDLERASAVAGRLECGTVWANSHMALAPDLPFGGTKRSGIGVENGPWGLAEFTELQLRYDRRS